MKGSDPLPAYLGKGDTPLTLRQAEAIECRLATARSRERIELTLREAETLALAQWGRSVYRLARQEAARRRALAGEVWFDFDPDGDCPLCGKSLAYAHDDVGRPGPDHATCGNGATPHRWLVYWRKSPKGCLAPAYPSRMRLLKEWGKTAVPVGYGR